MGTPGLNVVNTIQGMADQVEKRRVKKKASIDICSFFLPFAFSPLFQTHLPSCFPPLSASWLPYVSCSIPVCLPHHSRPKTRGL